MLAFILCYLDPGNSSYIVQIIIAAIVGLGVFFKSWWWKIRDFFSFLKRNKK